MTASRKALIRGLSGNGLAEAGAERHYLLECDGKNSLDGLVNAGDVNPIRARALAYEGEVVRTGSKRASR